jgi:hypothetical protein
MMVRAEKVEVGDGENFTHKQLQTPMWVTVSARY